MKKLIILIALVFTTVGYSQAEFEKIAITENGASASTNRINTQEVNGEINYIDAANLPLSTATIDSLGLKALRESGVLDFDGLAINADPTKFDIGAGFGFISNSLTGGVTKVTWTAQTAQTTPYIATSVATYVLKDDTGTTVLQNSYPTNEQFRTHIYLGKLAHTTFTAISFVVNDPSRSFSVAGDFHDFVNSIGSINIEGNAITPNGANLNINVSAGKTYREGANFMNNRNSPNITTEPAVNATPFRNKFRNGSGGWNAVNTSTVDPNYYDDGSGILQLVANNKFTVKVVYRFGGTGTIHMDYGQVVYDDLNAADAGIANSVASDPDTKGFASRIGWIIIKQGTTSLLTSGDYKFVAADLFGVRAATSAPAPTLQAAYNGSVTPQITTTTGGGAVAVRRGSGADTDTIIVGQNGAGTVTSSFKGNGEIYTAATPTATAFSHYHGQTASDGIIRPKTLANVQTEIVTTTAVDAAKPGILTGTGTTNTIPKITGTGVIGNSNLSDSGTLVSSAVDLSISGARFGIGGGSNITNVTAGALALQSNTSGSQSIALGYGALQNQTTSFGNLAIGSNSLSSVVGGTGQNAVLGNTSFAFLTTGSGNVAMGNNSGMTNSSGGNTTVSDASTLIGYNTMVLNNSSSNELVVGSNAIGLGSNTSVFGNSSTTHGRWWGNFLVGTSTNNGNIGRFAGTVDVNKLQLNTTPENASGTPPLLTWNSTTKDVESVPYATFATNSNVVKLTGESNQNINSDIDVEGTLTAASFIKEGAVTGQLLRADGSSTVGYKVYTATISDSGTSTPNVTVLENTTGGTVTWSDTNAGYYQATISGSSFTSNKTYNQSTIATGATSSTADITSTTTIRFYAWNGTSTVDGSTMNVEIRIYN